MNCKEWRNSFSEIAYEGLTKILKIFKNEIRNEYWNTSPSTTTAVYKSMNKYTLAEIEEMDRVLRHYKELED